MFFVLLFWAEELCANTVAVLLFLFFVFATVCIFLERGAPEGVVKPHSASLTRLERTSGLDL